MVVLRGHPRIVVRNDTNFPHGCRGTSARADADSARADADSAQADADFPCRRARIFRADSG